jgi:hypothetical protein
MITTAILPAHVSEWKVRVGDLSTADRHKLFWETDAIFCDVRSVDLNTYDFYPEIIFSIQILAASLSLARLHVWDPKDDFALYVLESHNGLASRGSKFALERLEEAGWCPKEVIRRGSLGIAGLYFASLFPEKTSKLSHSSCTFDKCMEDFIDLETYETVHTSDGCNCEFIGPDLSQVHSIIEKGEVPLFKLSNTQPLHVDVVSASKNYPYTAISHVWKDGLGNTKKNLLPLCQVSRLRDLVRAVKLNDMAFSYDMTKVEKISLEAGKMIGATLGAVLKPFVTPFLNPQEASIYIWIDAICVPIKKPYRSMALSRIKEAFERATAVLILDAGLQQVSSRATFSEVCVRIFCSRWMRRLWTLEEAIVAPPERLYLQLSDAIISLDIPEMDVTSMIPAARYPSQSAWPGSVIHYSALMEISSMRSKYRDASDERKLLDLFSLIQRRYTTKDSDVPVVVASTLGLDVSQLSTRPVQDRMETLFLLREYWPSCLIFTLGPHLRYPYGWAPKSLLAGMIITRTQLGRRTKWGLMFEFPGYSLCSQEPVLLSQPFNFVNSEDNSHYGVIPATWPGSNADGEPVYRFAIILAEDTNLAADTRNSYIGVIVTMASEYDEHDDDIIICQYKCLAAVSRDEDALDKLYTGKVGLKRWFRKANEDVAVQPQTANISKLICGCKKSSTQTWCVG